MEPALSPPGSNGSNGSNGDGAGSGSNVDEGPSDNLNTWLDAINLSHVYDSLVELGATKVNKLIGLYTLLNRGKRNVTHVTHDM